MVVSTFVRLVGGSAVSKSRVLMKKTTGMLRLLKSDEQETSFRLLVDVKDIPRTSTS